MRSSVTPSGAAGEPPAAPEGAFRIVSWNCQGGCAKKGAHMTALRPDLAVVSEAGPHALRDVSLDWPPTAGALAGPHPELGVFALGDTRLEVLDAHPGDARSPLIAARVAAPSLSFIVVAVCVRPTETGPRHGRYADALLQALERHEGLLRAGPAVVVGDFNTSAALDRTRNRRDHLRVVDALAGLGLASAWHHMAGAGHGDEPTGTFHMYRWPHSDPLHLDYCFVPEAWLPRVRTAWIGPPDPWLTRSDHLPLVVDVAVSQT
ncbi:MAG: endonuclease/exonuclease/phosphatase family protein [Thermoleophilia bacterium]